MSKTEQATDPVPTGDSVAAMVQEVRDDLAAKRASGAIPHLPNGELDRQFSAVVEAVDAGLVEEPSLDTADLVAQAELPSWRPRGGGVKGLLTRPLVDLLARVVGVIVRRQVETFSRHTARLVDDLAQRQNRLGHFVARAHLDRIRSLEHRVAELERRIDALQSAGRT